MENIKNFTDKIISLQASVINAFGSGVPGNIGSSTQGAITPTNEVLGDLRQSTLALADEYSKNGKDSKELPALKDAVEGSLLTLQTLSLITEKQADDLIDELRAL